MKRNDAGARCGEIRHDAVNRLHHQMHVDGGGNTVFAQGFQHHRADGQVRHIVVVHDVKMHDIRTSSQHFRGVLTQAGKISRQN